MRSRSVAGCGRVAPIVNEEISYQEYKQRSRRKQRDLLLYKLLVMKIVIEEMIEITERHVYTSSKNGDIMRKEGFTLKKPNGHRM
ncbi:hypothetical protein CK934_06655 [Chitinophaga sp. MD30]|nr:hypothetical protein CK934_06655 [Chitinophaga sp. MD30]